MKRILFAAVAVLACGGTASAMCFSFKCMQDDTRALGDEVDCEDAGLNWRYCMDRYDHDRKMNERLNDLEDNEN